VIACVAALTACSDDGSEHPEPTTNVFSQFPGMATSRLGQESLPPCVQPTPMDTPGWLPEDLPLPPGSYLSQDFGQTNGYQRGVFVVPGSLTDLARFVLTEWPKQGWSIGHGDSEEDEIETSLSKPPAAAAIKAQGVECSPGYSLLLLIYAPDRTAAGPIPGTQGGSPLPTPTD
jgi:hypothetical protein